ncbi:HAD-IA family hydrolase [Psychromarinibacter halotolerans]|uniref:phosphoglycolate phosphatase n=1 Tax=Psychromarinibacter halotolerans TaxID=1775175 RepID=A0ABV7GX00_9RHOB|nr:HAD-IA family hydrolase [Psychromarinibacter halotolerans]MDF0598152.1 HAD-IA family hydrolase [Psychromarinibacter halotolerans]
MKTVVFDLDGTLADTSGDLIAAANASFERLGHGALLDPVADAGTAFRGGRAMLRLGLERAGALDEATVDAAYPDLLDWYGENIDVFTTMYPGSVDAVDALRSAGYKVSVCTNKPEGLAETLLQRLGVRDLFDALVGADTLPVRKPEPAPYVAAVERAGGVVATSYLLGDTVTDRKTARAVGVPCALVTFGPDGHGVSKLEPEALLHGYEDLADVTQRLIGHP